jgi:hypothetical protein
MKTSQSYYGNTDGSTSFWRYSSSTKLTCDTLEQGGYLDDGTLGRKLFYEARGYEVGDCYNQKTDNQVIGGFSFADYKAKIDAGYPVFLNLEGHSVVGLGYDDSTSETVLLHDTWDYGIHEMPWGGSYAGLQLQAVSIADTVQSPLVVDLVRFEAWPEWPAIHVQWETTNEVDNLGFNLYRAEAGNEEYTRVRLNQELIPAIPLADSSLGAIYDWIDEYEVCKERTYLYWLEDVDIYGRTITHGPVSVSVAKAYWFHTYLPQVSK